MNNHSLFGRLRSWLPLIPPMLLLAGTYWLNLQVQPIQPKSDDNKRHDVDYSVENISSVTFDENGLAHTMMTTEKMWHYPDDDSTYLQAPNIVNLNKDSAPMVTSAKTGKVSGRGDEVFLYDDVKIIRFPSGVKEQMVFTSDYLHAMPDKDLADTDRPVTIESPSNTVHAVGMTIDNKSHLINLLSNVRVTHEPVHP